MPSVFLKSLRKPMLLDPEKIKAGVPGVRTDRALHSAPCNNRRCCLWQETKRTVKQPRRET